MDLCVTLIFDVPCQHESVYGVTVFYSLISNKCIRLIQCVRINIILMLPL